MPYTKSHKARTRARIVESAARAYREHGVEGVGIADIMRDAGLTHGGFYAHFPNKDALLAEATQRGLAETREEFLAGAVAASPDAPLREIIRRYVSRSHRDDAAGGCAMPALAGELAREPDEVRHAFTDAFEELASGIAAHCPGENPEARRDAALALTAGMVGAVALARAVDDPTLSDRILLATRRFYTDILTDIDSVHSRP
ncbi:MAG TPA: TetR/AcrR family transcriptional regulator [Ktedonobacterales bacterium]|nr:TetR/AcrR family transcriptional regulator [Ktedonobacterales bacterium]